MTEKPYFVYTATEIHGKPDNRYFIGVSHDPYLDLKILSTFGYNRLRVIAGPLPLAQAMYRAEKYERNSVYKSPVEKYPVNVVGFLSKILGNRKSSRFFNDIIEICDTCGVVLPRDEDLSKVTDVIYGRILFDHEIRRALLEHGYNITSDLPDILQTLILTDAIRRIPSVSLNQFKVPSCNRCGNRDIVRVSCKSCSKEDCLYCPECASMGQARACRPLYCSPLYPFQAGDNRIPASKDFEINLDFLLTEAQKDASRLIVDFLRDTSHDECLVFAVCGAGKTEVIFQGIAYILRHGGKVLFATPRSDIVAEIVPRITSAIPEARVMELHSGVKTRYQNADIIVATTHQTIRFFQAFDLVVLDEVDAFPYRGSKSLHYAVRQATSLSGKTVFMTATPSKDMLRKTQNNKMALVRIPARYHGQPLPEPEIIRVRLPIPRKQRDRSPLLSCGIKDSGIDLPGKIVALIGYSLQRGRKIFVFVPTVKLSYMIAKGLAVLFQTPSGSIEIPGSTSGRNPTGREFPRVVPIHAAHPDRNLYREGFRRGNIDVIVTTTILERGITVPNSDVFVLYADYERIFDTSALIQMAGRAGRTKNDTEAKVFFVANQVTQSMRSAIKLIQDMNACAAESGYLKPMSRHSR
ncbi:MAG: DEAD/DEAH box helicase [Firmicutes bacterium]|jgi:competence protein ComFA|nr:DEAD/DEAH box helicase [Bacillota bacterium]